MSALATDIKRTLLDVETIRRYFPIFSIPENKDLIYFDNAATVQRPQPVLDAIQQLYTENNANPHRGAYRLAERATFAHERARVKVARFIGSESSEQIIFTRNTTEAINLVAAGWANKFVTANDEIVITELEHHSNLVPWQMVAKKTGAQLRFIEFDMNGELELEKLDQIINKKTKIVAVTHISNSLGTIVPLQKIIQIAHNCGAKVLVDGAQAVAHFPVNVRDLDTDFYAFSAHKMMGPMGIGVLYGKRELLEEMDPVNFGGNMISNVERYESTWNELPYKFEGGTQDIAGAVGLGEAIDFILQIGQQKIHDHEQVLTQYALEKLHIIPDIRIFGPAEKRAAVISFDVSGVHPHDLATFLDDKNIAIRAGHHCAKIVMKKLNVAATARASFYMYNSIQEIDKFVAALLNAKEFFSKWH